VAQAQEANKKTQELALKTEVTVAWVVIKWVLLRARLENYAIKDEAENVDKMVEKATKMIVLTADVARKATRETVIMAAKMYHNSTKCGTSSFENKMSEILAVVKVLIAAQEEAGNLTQSTEIAELKEVLAGI
jgi:hypothetical protein